MWLRLRWRVCIWACLVIAGAVGVGRVVQVLSVDGVDRQNQDSQDRKNEFDGILADQYEELVWFMQVNLT